MKFPNLSDLCKKTLKSAEKHSPEILIGVGIAGFVTSTILAVTATPKAIRLIEARKEELEVEELTALETVKTAGKCYIPAAISTVASAACIIGAKKIDMKRNAALATAYSITQESLKTYQRKVIETIGENKEQKIRDEIAKDKLNENPPEANQVVVTGTGQTLCYLKPMDKYFECDIEKIRKAEAKLNSILYSEMFVSVNDFYEQIGLRCFSELGDELGWNVDDGPIEFQYSSQLTENDKPVFVIDFRIEPRFDYRTLH